MSNASQLPRNRVASFLRAGVASVVVAALILRATIFAGASDESSRACV